MVTLKTVHPTIGNHQTTVSLL